MTDYIKVARIDEIPESGKQIFEVDDRLIVVLRVDGGYYCLDDVCTHDGGTLGEGHFCDFQISCPRHGAKFDIRTGQALTMPATEPTVTHEVKVDDSFIYVKLNDD